MSQGFTRDGIVEVEKNGSTVGARPRLNFIEGSNVTLTVADDAANSEIDVTIASAAGGASELDDLSDVSVNTPTDGELLAYGGATPMWRNVEASAHSHVDPGAGSSDFYDDFSGDTLDASWVKVEPTASSLTVTQSKGLASLKVAGSVGNNTICGFLYPLTMTATEDLVLEMAWRAWAPAQAYSLAGPLVTDGTTVSSGNQIWNAGQLDQYRVYNIFRRHSGFNSAVATSGNNYGYIFGGRVFSRIHFDGGTGVWDAEFSPDGISWAGLGEITYTYDMTPTHVGFGLSPWSGSRGFVCTLEYVKATVT